jgi:hypothetical protein
MMGRVVRYVHHGRGVMVDEDLKGKHRLFCLCHRCSDFFPGDVCNCPAAEMNFSVDKIFGLVTPVWECPRFHEKMVIVPAIKVGG